MRGYHMNLQIYNLHTDIWDRIEIYPMDFTDLRGCTYALARLSTDLYYGAIIRTLRSVWLYILTFWAEIREDNTHEV